MSTTHFTMGLLLAFACTQGDGDASDGDTDGTPPDNTDLVLSPIGVIDDDHPTIVHVTWSTPESLSGWVEFGLDGAFDKRSPTVAAVDHVHQLRGLKAGHAYGWRAVVQVGEDLVTSDPQIVDVPPPPADLPTFQLVVSEPASVVANAYVTVAGSKSSGGGAGDEPNAPFYVGIIDGEGDFVWYHLLPYARGTSALDISLDGSSVWWMEVDNARQEVNGNIIRMALDGTVLSETQATTGHHAAVELSGGRFAHLGRAFWPDPEEEDVTLMTDRVLIETEGDTTGAESIVIFDYLDDWWGGDFGFYWQSLDKGGDDLFGYINVVDMTHSNSLAWVESENALYPYARILDTLMKVDADTGALQWQMSGLYSDFTFPDGDPVYEGRDNSYLWSWGHYSQAWPGGFTFFDNGVHYSPEVSSIVEIAYDEVTGDVEEVFRYEDPEGGWTFPLGDVWKLTSGNYLASWMTLRKLTEVTPAGELVWQVNPEIETTVRRVRPVSDLYTLTVLSPPLP